MSDLTKNLIFNFFFFHVLHYSFASRNHQSVLCNYRFGFFIFRFHIQLRWYSVYLSLTCFGIMPYSLSMLFQWQDFLLFYRYICIYINTRQLVNPVAWCWRLSQRCPRWTASQSSSPVQIQNTLGWTTGRSSSQTQKAKSGLPRQNSWFTWQHSTWGQIQDAQDR